MLIYRLTAAADYDRIIELKNTVKSGIEAENLPIWKDGYPTDEMIMQDIRRGNGRVMQEDGEIVAYAFFGLSDEEYPVGTFRRRGLTSFARIMVDPQCRGRHVAYDFISAMKNETEHMGKAGMGITVDACNTRAVRLYTKHGFVREGEADFPYAHLDIYACYFDAEI